MQLFTVDKKGLVIFHPDAMKLASEFSYLEQNEMLCVILAYDYYSIYRQFPEDQRKSRARAHVFGHQREDFFTEHKIIKAVAKYKELQFDPLREQIIAMRNKMNNINMLIDSLDEVEDGIKRQKDLISISSDYRKRIKEAEEDLFKEEEIGLQEDAEKTGLSFLEKLQSNSESYKAMKTRIGGITGPKQKDKK